MLASFTVALSEYEGASKWTSEIGGNYAATSFGV